MAPHDVGVANEGFGSRAGALCRGKRHLLRPKRAILADEVAILKTPPLHNFSEGTTAEATAAMS